MMNITVNDNHRPFANVIPTPSLWGDQFLNYTSNPRVTEKHSEEIERLKNEVRSMLTSSAEGRMADNLIDTVERLGLSYHFEIEIEEKIKQLFNLIKTEDYKDEGCDLYTAALHFRLFRQHGYPISSAIFEKWRDGNGKFHERLMKNDPKGLLSLYEACCLRTHGETLLDDALVFAAATLKSMAADQQLGSPLRKQVEHALFQHLHYGIPRIEARHFISVYQEEEHANESLLRLAKLDYNALQTLHKKELSEVTRWWKELNLISKLPYARDRIVECFFWAMGVFDEPQYSRARVMLAKSLAMTSILDDTYDSYATIQELDLLTQAIEKWDIKETDSLPEYIKEFYKAQLKLYEQFEEELAEEGRSYAAHYAIEAYKELARSYHVEAKWFIRGYLPAFQEYLNNALITGTVNYHVMVLFMGMESISKEDFEWLRSTPKMIKATQLINRLIDDLATYEGEKEKGQAATGIECYMKEKGATKEEAMKYFSEAAANAWKDSNEECLVLSSRCRDIYVHLLNYNRIVDVTYNKNNQDGYSNPEKVLKPHLMALFVDQIQL